MTLPIKKASKVSEAMVWYHFVPRSSPEGAAWYEQYKASGCEDIAILFDTGVAMMRKRQVAEGKALLDKGYRQLEETGRRHLPRSVYGVAEEGYWSGIAYYHYHVEQFEQARQALDSAQRIVNAAISEAPFLSTFATRCHDLCLHDARVSRGLRQWRDMWSFIQQAREMVRGERPLCQPSWGSIYMEDALSFFRAVEPENDVEREALGYLLDEEKSLTAFEQRALGATLIPTAIIPW